MSEVTDKATAAKKRKSVPVVASEPAKARAARKVREGIVKSAKMQKTIVVQVSRQVQHPAYGRVVRHTNAFKAHDEKNEARPGDVVKIMETRPISKDKRWRLLAIVRRASLAPAVPGEPSQAKPQTKRAKPSSASPAAAQPEGPAS